MKDPLVFLLHILNSIKNIEKDTQKFSKEKFFLNRTVQDAVIRNIEILGEAAKNIPKDFREKYKEVPWSEMARMRDMLIHGYFKVDLEAVWEVIEKDLPKLKEQVSKLLKEEKKVN